MKTYYVDPKPTEPTPAPTAPEPTETTDELPTPTRGPAVLPEPPISPTEDTNAVDDGVPKKRGPGRPKGSKNKKKRSSRTPNSGLNPSSS